MGQNHQALLEAMEQQRISIAKVGGGGEGMLQARGGSGGLLSLSPRRMGAFVWLQQ